MKHCEIIVGGDIMPTYVALPSFNMGKDDLVAENVIYDDKERGIKITVQDMLDYLEDAVIASGAKIYYDTSENWNKKSSLISEKGSLYIYSDKFSSGDIPIPAIKVGDGNAYVIDLPFTSDILNDHINNMVVHLSARDRWKLENSVCAEMSQVDEEELKLFK